MIYFIAPQPNPAGENEGFRLRVAAIDKIFKGVPKKYFQRELLTKHAADLVDCDVIYVHSLFMAKDVVHLYRLLGAKIVTDLHGLVPEETMLAGKRKESEEFAAVEAEVFKYGRTFVAVSEQMRDYYIKKYRLKSSIRWIILPIFDEQPTIERTEKKDTKLGVIYAGGAQAWQNVDMMIESIRAKSSQYHFTILTPDINDFEQKLGGADLPDVTIKMVSRAETTGYYKTHDLGFVLRDDIAVNNVACPTKLVEYLHTGVVPIVLQPGIGDFKKLGYSYVLYDDFIADKVPDSKELESMRENNYKVVKALEEQTRASKRQLVEIPRHISKITMTQDEVMDAEFAQVYELANKRETAICRMEYENYVATDRVAHLEGIIRDRDRQLERIHGSWFGKLRTPGFLRRHISHPFRTFRKLFFGRDNR